MSDQREQLVVTITPDGAVVAKTHGIKGNECLDYIALLEDLLEAETTSSAFTSEYTETKQGSTIEAADELPQQ